MFGAVCCTANSPRQLMRSALAVVRPQSTHKGHSSSRLSTGRFLSDEVAQMELTKDALGAVFALAAPETGSRPSCSGLFHNGAHDQMTSQCPQTIHRPHLVGLTGEYISASATRRFAIAAGAIEEAFHARIVIAGGPDEALFHRPRVGDRSEYGAWQLHLAHRLGNERYAEAFRH